MISELPLSQVVIAAAMPAKSGIVAESAVALFSVVYAILPLLVFLGLTLVAVGGAKAKNALSTAFNQWVMLAMTLIAFVGFGVLILEGRIPASDWQKLLMGGGLSDSDSSWAVLVFQLGIVAIALTVACRSMIDRIRLRGLLVFSILFSGIVFPVIAQWGWGSRFSVPGGFNKLPPGWLELVGVGFYDFAGAGVIHIVGGAFALAGAIVVGGKRGSLLGNGRLRFQTGHQPLLVAVGVVVALIGWCGLHLGFAALSSSSGEKVVVATLVASAASGLSAMCLYRLLFGGPGFYTTLYGVLGGLVSVSACAASITPVGALIVGGVAGVLVVLGTLLIEKTGIDDSGSVVPVHFVCGGWGIAAVAFFGPAEMRSFEGLKTQLLGAAVFAGGAFVIAIVLLKLIDNLFGLRVSGEHQQLGSDFHEHSLNAYPDFDKVDKG